MHIESHVFDMSQNVIIIISNVVQRNNLITSCIFL